MSNLHNAQDAVVVACIGDELIQRITKYDKFKRTILANRSQFEKLWTKVWERVSMLIARLEKNYLGLIC